MTGMNRPIKRVAIAALVMFLILLVDVNYLQAVEAPSLANRPRQRPHGVRPEPGAARQHRDRRRRDDRQHQSRRRGLFQYQRTYPGGRGVRAGHRLRHDLHAGAGAQLRDRRRARGERPADRHRVAARVPQLHRHAHQQAAEGRDRSGHDQLQGPASGLPAAAGDPPGQDHQRQAAGRRRGRAQPVHRRDPGDGLLPELRPEPARGARTPPSSRKVDNQLTAENPSPLLNNATQTTLPPGSTFKIVTSSAWYTQNPTRNPHAEVASPQPLTLPNGNTLSNDNGEQCGTGSRPDPGDLRVRPVLQHPVRQDRRRARRPDDQVDGHASTASTTRARSTSPA